MTNHIALKPVSSSNIEAVGYSPATQTLAVQFKRGKVAYHYSPVTQAEHDAIHTAPSVGKHIQEHFVRKFKTFSKHDI